MIKLCEKLEALEAVNDEEWCYSVSAELEQIDRRGRELMPIVDNAILLDNLGAFSDERSQQAAFALRDIFVALSWLYKIGRMIEERPVSISRWLVGKYLSPPAPSCTLREYCSHFLNLG